MKFVVLLVLAALWAVVLVPPLLRARASRSNDSIGDFNYRLGVLSRTNPGARRRGRGAPRPRPVLAPAVVPGRLPPIPSAATARQRSAKRRRDITLGLLVAAVLTLGFAALAHTAALWALQIFFDVLIVTYLALIAWVRSQRLDRRDTVHYLPKRRAPELALRRTASS